MDTAEIIVTAGGIALIAVLAWFFFGPRTAREAALRGGVQEVEIEVRGGYSPNLIRLRQGVPVRLVFDRQDSSECTSRVVFPDFGIGKSLEAFGQTSVEFTPDRSGELTFACGMNMRSGESLDHLIIVNERHLRTVLSEFVRHYNARPHRALELAVPREAGRAPPWPEGRLIRHPTLGGLTHEYDREAA